MPRRKKEPESTEWITNDQRVALLRDGVVVVASSVHREQRQLDIASPLNDAHDRTAAVVGPGIEIELISETPRFISPIHCVGHMEREERRLQLRIVTGTEQHVDEILVAEDDDVVVVYATACYPASFELGERCDCPHHVYLEMPLGRRTVYDGAYGCEVPYRNVYAEMDAEDRAGDVA